MFDRLDDILIHYEELMQELNKPVCCRGSEPFSEADEGTGRFSRPGRSL